MLRDSSARFCKACVFFCLVVAPGLAGCPGTLELWQLGGVLPDDDDGASQFDYSSFEGAEFINIDWDQEAWPQGVDDCQAGWHALGSESTAADQALCPVCAHIWTVQLTYLGTADACLQGTALPAPTDDTVRFGFEVLGDASVLFTVWRSVAGGEMIEAGIGAIDEDRAEFTWSGQESYRTDGEIIGYEWYLSGEGSF